MAVNVFFASEYWKDLSDLLCLKDKLCVKLCLLCLQGFILELCLKFTGENLSSP